MTLTYLPRHFRLRLQMDDRSEPAATDHPWSWAEAQRKLRQISTARPDLIWWVEPVPDRIP